MSDYTTLAELIKNSIERFGERPYLGTKIAGTYRWLTYAEFDIKMRKLRAALHRFGLKKGDVVAIIANNSVPFALTMYASYGLGAVMVPMYEVQRPQDWDFILRNSNARFLFVTNDTIRTQIEALHIENLEKIITIRSEDPQSPHSFDRIIEEETGFMDHIALDPDSDADILYTSGTAGQPKGVVLSHANIVENVKRVLSCFSISETDRTLAFLPWAHAFGKTTELHAFPSLGASVALVESNRTIAQNLLEINPTVLVAVPKIFNKIYDTVHQRAQNKPIAKTLLAHSEYIAQKARRNQELSAFNKLQRVVLDRLVGKKIRAAFGNALRFCISGGAALSEEVAFFFDDFGVVICEGYGLSESGPIVAVNTPDDRRIGAAGKPLPGVPVRIEPLADQTDSQQGEIIVGGPCIMKRYHLAPEETANALTDNHELRTGDMGFIDSDGNLWVTGRVKEQYKLENGKYVVPSVLESKICASSIIENAIVLGAGKPYNVALIQPSSDFLESFKAEHHLINAAPETLQNNPKLRDLIATELKNTCERFRGYERPQKFAIILNEPSIANGLLTPTLKLKRREVEKQYHSLIASLYTHAN